MIILDLPGNPIPWKRVGINRKTGGVYDQQHEERENYRWLIRSQYKEKILTGPVIVKTLFRFPIPKSVKGKIKRIQMLTGMIVPNQKPDNDNLEKLIYDCMTGVIYEDDSQIVDNITRKRFSESPGVTIWVQPYISDMNAQEDFDKLIRDHEMGIEEQKKKKKTLVINFMSKNKDKKNESNLGENRT